MNIVFQKIVYSESVVLNVETFSSDPFLKKMKIKQADEMQFVLNRMLQIKGIVGFKIARNLRMINDELKEYNEVKQSLFEKYGTEKDGNLVIDKFSDNYTNFLKEIAPYEEQDVNFDFKRITEDEFMASDLTAEQVLILTEYFGE